jgi:serine/threonine protein kinase
MLAQVGQIFADRYRVEAYIAEGGMQQVYLVEDLSFGRRVALKIPKNASAQKRFAKSACVSARIVHSNVAKTLDYFETEGKSYLVEEFIEGMDLGKLIKYKYQYFDPHLAAHVFHLIAKGVAASHHVGVIHRDMKPNNVMVGGGPNIDVVKITDFGIAKMAEQEIADAAKDGEASMSNSSTAMGALPYMAPEMIETPKAAGTAADVWAIGAILYRLISGQYPFGSGWAAMRNIISGKPPSKPDILTLRPQFALLGNQLWTIIESCFKYDPADRPSADDIVEFCGQLCYSNAERTFGVVESYNTGKGAWGYLVADDGDRIFFHRDSYYGQEPTPKIMVNFARFPGEPCARASPVLPLRGDLRTLDPVDG